MHLHLWRTNQNQIIVGKCFAAQNTIKDINSFSVSFCHMIAITWKFRIELRKGPIKLPEGHDFHFMVVM
jgi:hypothetical protein